MASTSAQTVLPDEIWEEILLRLDAAADLARASAACTSFRSIVSERRFLRRFRRLHSPAVLGYITVAKYREFIPVEPPHRSAPEARALVQAADFTFSFLRAARTLRFRNARDGRVLLSRCLSTRRERSAGIAMEDFVVCDPLHRRYIKIPRVPDDLVGACTPHTGRLQFTPVLAPDGENEEEGSFRVICLVLFKDKVIAFVFSSCNQTWQVIISTVHLLNKGSYYHPYYAHDCIYWVDYRVDYSLVLDTSEMKFSVIDVPPHNRYSTCAIVEVDEGRLGFLTIGDGTIDLYCKNWQRNAVGAQEWQHDKLIPLPKHSGRINYHWSIEGPAGRYLALVAQLITRGETPPYPEHFILDIKTLLVEKLCTTNNVMFYGFPYARFPPPFALPSI